MDVHLIRVTALKAFEYEGRALEVGDCLEVRPVIAAALRYQGRIALDSDLGPRQAVRRAAPRRYKRRDLKAEE